MTTSPAGQAGSLVLDAEALSELQGKEQDDERHVRAA